MSAWVMPLGPGSTGQGTFCATLRISRQEDRKTGKIVVLKISIQQNWPGLGEVEAWTVGILMNFLELFFRAPQLLAWNRDNHISRCHEIFQKPCVVSWVFSAKWQALCLVSAHWKPWFDINQRKCAQMDTARSYCMHRFCLFWTYR